LTLSFGYFRYDDFDFVSFAQLYPLRELLLLPHGDHVLPLSRILAHAYYHSFGVAAWPANLAILLCMAGTVVMGCRILHALDVSRFAQAIFTALVLLWSPWAEVMSGYYILSTYVLIVFLSLTAYLAFLGWQHRRHARYPFVLSLCCLLGPLIDVSGAYLLPAGLVMFAGDWLTNGREAGLRSWWGIQRPMILSWCLACTLAVGSLVYAYAIAHPGVFLGMSGEAERSLLRLAFDTGYAFSAGLLVSMGAPFIYARLPLTLLTILCALALACWAAIAISGFRRSTSPRRTQLGVMLAIVLGICLMVAMGRPSDETPVVRWAAKHVGPAYLWLCLFLAACWDNIVRSLRELSRTAGIQLTALAVLAFGALQGGFDWLGMAVDFPPFGYPAEIRDAVRRRAAIDSLKIDVMRPFSSMEPKPAAIPTLDGPFIEAHHRSLFIYNLSRYQPFFEDLPFTPDLIRNDAMQQPALGRVDTVPSLRTAAGPEIVAAINKDPRLKRYYFGRITLNPLSVPSGPSSPGATQATDDAYKTAKVDPGERHEIVVRQGTWDPETASLLRLALERLTPASAAPINVAVTFWSEAFGADWTGYAELPASGETVTFDLLQVYAFALSGRVGNLRLHLSSSGEYRLVAHDLVP
jgi:hypothetical protein